MLFHLFQLQDFYVYSHLKDQNVSSLSEKCCLSWNYFLCFTEYFPILSTSWFTLKLHFPLTVWLVLVGEVWRKHFMSLMSGNSINQTLICHTTSFYWPQQTRNTPHTGCSVSLSPKEKTMRNRVLANSQPMYRTNGSKYKCFKH